MSHLPKARPQASVGLVSLLLIIPEMVKLGHHTFLLMQMKILFMMMEKVLLDGIQITLRSLGLQTTPVTTILSLGQ